MNNTRRFLKFLRNDSIIPLLFKCGKLYLISIVAVICCVFTTATPYFSGKFINAISEHTELLRPASQLIICAMIALLTEWVLRRMAILGGRKAELAVQQKLLEELQTFSPGGLNEIPPGELAAKFLRDATNISAVIRDFVGMFIMTTLGLIIALGLVFSRNATVGWVFLCTVPFTIFCISPLNKRLKKENHVFRVGIENTMNSIYDFFNDLPYLKAHSAHLFSVATLKNTFSDQRKYSERFEFATLSFEIFIRIFLFAGEYGVLISGGILAWYNKLTIGDVVMFQMLFMQALGALSGVFRTVPYMSMTAESFRSISELFKFCDKEDDAGKKVLKNFTGEIKFDQVSYHYPNRTTDAITQFSEKFSPGEVVALTGNNGCGKTTLIKLATTFLEPSSGNIFFDNVNSKEINHSALRKSFATLFQDSIIIKGTFLENLTLGEKFSDNELGEVIKLCGLKTLIKKLPNGLSTLLDHTQTLSGGERQRTAIARILLRKPRVAVLDEVNNHLDKTGMELLNSLIGKLRKNTTIIIISHDPTIIELADREIKM